MQIVWCLATFTSDLSVKLWPFKIMTARANSLCDQHSTLSFFIYAALQLSYPSTLPPFISLSLVCVCHIGAYVFVSLSILHS